MAEEKDKPAAAMDLSGEKVSPVKEESEGPERSLTPMLSFMSTSKLSPVKEVALLHRFLRF